MNIKKTYWEYAAFVIPILLAVICLISATLGSQQAMLAIPMPQEFIGEYSYDNKNWKPVTEEADISARNEDVFLRGNFLREMEEGWHLSFYRNHIGVSLKVNGEQIYADDIDIISDMQTNLFASVCAREWVYTIVPDIGTEDVIEIHLHNPHVLGNKTAYRDFLATLCSDPVGSNLLEQNLASYGDSFRILGALLAVASLMQVGAAIAAVIAHIPVWGVLFRMGLMTLFAGGYVAFDTIDVSYWNNLNIMNTYASQLCMMLAVFCLGHVVSDIFTGGQRRVAKIAVLLSALLNSIMIILSFTGVIAIFDTLPYWIALQLVLCPLFMICCMIETFRGSGLRLMIVSAFLLFAAILMDIAGVGGTIVWRASCSKIVFSVLFVVHVVAAARSVIRNHHASIHAAKLEKELEDSRIAIMLSQIKPHFLYNVLNTIYHLYRKEPEMAQEAVSNFAEYLRCNMLSIEKLEPIPFREEYQHIQTYLTLERIRFGDKLDVVYDVNVTDFKLPPLTVEPLVENAVKHGITKKRGGGTVTISTCRMDQAVFITVSDTGIGFDPNHYMEDEKDHIGIRNVRNRLHHMVGGSLSITSSENGTVAVVTIPEKGGNNIR